VEKSNVDHGALADGIIAPVVSCSALLGLRFLRVELPAVMLTPGGRVDFGYIRSRLVTAGVSPIHKVGKIPFPMVVELFEYWKTNPPTHELLATAMKVLGVPDRTGGIQQPTTPDNGEPAPNPRRHRGRPQKIADALKERALVAQGGKARARILYETRYPTPQQVKNVSSILKHYQRTRQPNQG
jgi:hypothetical protein